MMTELQRIQAAEAKRIPNVPGYGHRLIGAWGFPKRQPTTEEARRDMDAATARFLAEREPAP